MDLSIVTLPSVAKFRNLLCLVGTTRLNLFQCCSPLADTRAESPKVRNRRHQKKFNGTSARPRLSIFCSTKQLYAMLIDDKNKTCLFYGSTLQKSIRDNPSCTTIQAAQRVGEELVKACITLKINEISSYDRHGFARGERMEAFEIAVSQHGFLPR
ncbi:hypothetical protein MKX01_040727 [Papaver californicum]|nr:hypothetical protein MKX01_040727 [Papaver californicum]